MEARYAFRKRQWLDECQVAPAIFEQVMPRRYTFMKPLGRICHGQAADQQANPLSGACGRTANAKTSQRSPIVLATRACPCTAALGGTRGTMRPGERRGGATSRRTWDTA